MVIILSHPLIIKYGCPGLVFRSKLASIFDDLDFRHNNQPSRMQMQRRIQMLISNVNVDVMGEDSKLWTVGYSKKHNLRSINIASVWVFKMAPSLTPVCTSVSLSVGECRMKGEAVFAIGWPVLKRCKVKPIERWWAEPFACLQFFSVCDPSWHSHYSEDGCLPAVCQCLRTAAA